MPVTVAEAVECIRSLKNYTVVVYTEDRKVPELRQWALKTLLIPINITNIGLEEQKVIFETIRASPSQYLLYYTEIPTSKMYKRLKSLVLLQIKDNFNYPDINSSEQEDISSVLIVSSIKTYIHDLIIQLRYNRFIHTGVPTYLLEMMHNYVKYLAMRQNIDYVLPTMVETAFKQIIPFQIKDLLITDASEDLTMLYGSDEKLVNEVRAIIDEYDVMMVVLTQVTHI